jgi:hypothetical protein
VWSQGGDIPHENRGGKAQAGRISALWTRTDLGVRFPQPGPNVCKVRHAAASAAWVHLCTSVNNLVDGSHFRAFAQRQEEAGEPRRLCDAGDLTTAIVEIVLLSAVEPFDQVCAKLTQFAQGASTRCYNRLVRELDTELTVSVSLHSLIQIRQCSAQFE